MDIDNGRRVGGGGGYSQGGGQPDAGRKGGNSGGSDRDDRIANAGLSPGYTQNRNIGNPYPGYRGPTGTRNPRARPEPTPTTGAGFNATDKARPSIWDRVFQPRRTPNPTPSYKMTAHNMTVLSGLMPGPALPAKIAAIEAGLLPGFKDYTGMVKGPGDYDPKNVAGGEGQSQFFDGVKVPRLLYSRGARPPRY